MREKTNAALFVVEMNVLEKERTGGLNPRHGVKVNTRWPRKKKGGRNPRVFKLSTPKSYAKSFHKEFSPQ